MKNKKVLLVLCIILIAVIAITGCRPVERPVPDPARPTQDVPAPARTQDTPAQDQRDVVPGQTPREPVPGGARAPGDPIIDEERPEERLPGQPIAR
ncbi:hypothetical protein [Alkaliphilus peptidifermentans]|uniref:Uncharacterized protein n=1 Tax=Alkaliphilus peptidifermentans DSM 18978 TaxID=1120976 RepID=A0A1G5AK33_9FIRM|nr:hypothetical protein [Alkaliphilus peptidifermentans]SCX78215.1 hypothetical protein SAMN03080606_00171 [Alkaliphilus peptidifermentans DSM 18978]